jgi:hypothetical protein
VAQARWDDNESGKVRGRQCDCGVGTDNGERDIGDMRATVRLGGRNDGVTREDDEKYEEGQMMWAGSGGVCAM